MEMKLANKESKSILAKLLASENLTVEHGKFNTASFDVKNRVLRLPIWKEMNGSLYDLLVLHEVGHALFTPAEGFHDAKGYGRGFKSFLNVVEDARIERKIKIKFPGGRRSFIDGYKNLMERDFFGVKRTDMTKLGLIDKINLHYKVGDYINLTFSDEENVFVDRIDKAQTWADVVKICKDLYEYAKENESETDMSDHEWDDAMSDDEDWDEDYDSSDFEYSEDDSEESNEESSSSEFDNESEENKEENESSPGSENSDEENKSGENESEETTEGGSSGQEGGTDGNFDPESKTDNNFRNNEIELVSEEAKPYRYINLPNKADLKRIIINHSELYKKNYKKHYSGTDQSKYSSYSGDEMMEAATKLFKDFRNKNKKIVEYLAKDFELKKAAKEHSRSATANSGILSSEKLYTYKYNEHIFKKLTITPDGKNHGLVMFVDWSGSMSRNMKGTIEQMMILVMFCKRVNIPFEVYAFSDSYTRHSDDTNDWIDSNGYMFGEGMRDYGTVALNRFNLLNLFSSKMRASELHEAYIYMTATANYYAGRQYYYDDDRINFFVPDRLHLGGTPLNSTLFVSFSVMRDFIKKNQVDVINSIFLTDGDSHSNNQTWVSEDETNHFDPNKENVIIRDSVSKKEIQITTGHSRYRVNENVTSALVKFSRKVFDINIVNFFLVNKMRRWDMADYLQKIDVEDECDSRAEHEDVTTALKKFRKDKFHIVPEMKGFNEQYTILGGSNLEVRDEQLVVAEGASVAQMTRAFKKFSGGKLERRRLLSRFIDMIAA